MPPRHHYWTIILEGKPTAFRAHTQEELIPTLRQLQGASPGRGDEVVRPGPPLGIAGRGARRRGREAASRTRRASSAVGRPASARLASRRGPQGPARSIQGAARREASAVRRQPAAGPDRAAARGDRSAAEDARVQPSPDPSPTKLPRVERPPRRTGQTRRTEALRASARKASRMRPPGWGGWNKNRPAGRPFAETARGPDGQAVGGDRAFRWPARGRPGRRRPGPARWIRTTGRQRTRPSRRIWAAALGALAGPVGRTDRPGDRPAGRRRYWTAARRDQDALAEVDPGARPAGSGRPAGGAWATAGPVLGRVRTATRAALEIDSGPRPPAAAWTETGRRREGRAEGRAGDRPRHSFHPEERPAPGRRDAISSPRSSRLRPAFHRFGGSASGRRVTHGLPGYEQMMRDDYEFAAVIEFDDVDGAEEPIWRTRHTRPSAGISRRPPRSRSPTTT